MKINFEKLLKSNIEVTGKCDGSCREQAIEDAIAIIQKQTDYLDTQYIGVKNYAHFGDQREDHGYGMCPRHGAIVFEIRKKDRKLPFTEDDIYYLMVSRDNPNISLKQLIDKKVFLDKEIEGCNQTIDSLEVK